MYYRSNLALLIFAAFILFLMGRCASTGNITRNPDSIEETNELISALSERIAELEEHKKTINIENLTDFPALVDIHEQELLTVAAPPACIPDGPVTITGTVLGNLSHLRLKRALPYQSDFSKKIELDEEGNFEIVLNLKSPDFYKLHAGKLTYDVFLKPGAQVELALDIEENNLVFTGDLASTNNFCSTSSNREENKYVFSDQDYTLEEKDFMAMLIQMRNADEHQLRVNSSGFDPDFIRMEQARFNCGYNRVLLKYNLVNGLAASDCNFEEPIIDAPELFGMYEYRKWAFEYFEAMSAQINLDEVKSKAQRLDHYATKYDQVEAHFSSDVLVDFMKTDVVYTCVARVCSPIMNDMVIGYYNDIDHKAFEEKISKRYSSMMKGKTGALAPQLKGRDRSGKTVSLDAYKGKYVYLFTWASWCGPCKMEVEPFHHLLQEFGGKNIEFVGVSIDKDKDKWLKSFTKSNAFPGNQIRIGGNWNSPFVEAYDIAAVPQGVLIGPDGTIIDSNAPKPSKLRNTLKGYNI